MKRFVIVQLKYSMNIVIRSRKNDNMALFSVQRKQSRQVRKHRWTVVVLSTAGLLILGAIVQQTWFYVPQRDSVAAMTLTATATATFGTVVPIFRPKVPFDSAGQYSIQFYDVEGDYNAAEQAKIAELSAVGANVVRYGMNLWDYATDVVTTTQIIDKRAKDEGHLKVFNENNATIVLELYSEVASIPCELGLNSGQFPVNGATAGEFVKALQEIMRRYSNASGNVGTHNYVRWYEFDNEPDINWSRTAEHSPPCTPTSTATGTSTTTANPSQPSATNTISSTPTVRRTATPPLLPTEIAGIAYDYVNSFRLFYNTIKAYNATLGVMNGGVILESPQRIKWFDAALTAGLIDTADVVAWHYYPGHWDSSGIMPYGGMVNVEDKAAAVATEIATVLAPATVNVITWNGESGLKSSSCDDNGCPLVYWTATASRTPAPRAGTATPTSTGTPPTPILVPATATSRLTTDDQAGQVVRMNVGARGVGLPGSNWFSWQDSPIGTSGVIGTKGNYIAKPSYLALLQLGKETSYSQAYAPTELPHGVVDAAPDNAYRGYTLHNGLLEPGLFVSVVWSPGFREPGAITIPAEQLSKLVGVTDMYGEAVATPLMGRTSLRLALTYNPYYLHWNYGFNDLGIYANYINYLAKKRIVSGYGDNVCGAKGACFLEVNSLTRGQAAKLIVGAGVSLATWTVTPGTAAGFKDVGVDFAYYINILVNKGIANGYTGPTFCPGVNQSPCFKPTATTTRGQMAKMLVVAAGWPIVLPARSSFTDLPASNPFYGFVETAKAHNVITGFANHTFLPYRNVTRGQASKMIYQTFVGADAVAPLLQLRQR